MIKYSQSPLTIFSLQAINADGYGWRKQAEKDLQTRIAERVNKYYLSPYAEQWTYLVSYCIGGDKIS